MDSSKPFQGSEGCSSSESGWTIYIASPMNEEDTECSDDKYNDSNSDHIITNHNDAGGGDDSDDSMASDASSGPSHREHICENGEGHHSMAHSKHDKGNNINKYSSYKKANTQEKKRGENKSKKEKKEDSTLITNTSTSLVQNGAR